MQKTTNPSLTSGPVFSRLMGFVIPYLLTSVLQVLYGVVDTYTIGIYTVPASISAVANGSKIATMVTVVVMGLSTGATVLIGRTVGEQDAKGAASAVGSTILLFSLFAVVITPLMLWLTPTLIRWVQTPEAAVRAARSYVLICSCGLPFIIAYNLICGILRAIGDSKTPVIFVAIACALNVGLDFLMVGALRMGTAGAAIATVASQSVSSICGVCYLLRHRLPFPMSARDLRGRRSDLAEILRVGSPVAVQNGCMHICFIILAAIANRRGVVDSAGVGVVETVINAVFLVPYAFEAASVTMTAQNLGAGKPERIRAVVGYSVLVGSVFGGLVLLACNLWGSGMIRIFTKDAAVILAGAGYLRTYSIDTMLAGISFPVGGYLCGKGRSGVVFVQNMMAIGLVRLPVAYLMSAKFPDTMLYMGLSSPGGSLFSILFFLCYLLIKKDMLLFPKRTAAER